MEKDKGLFNMEKKYFKVNETFIDSGLGIEFYASDENDEEITYEEVLNMQLKPLKDFENKCYHKSIRLVSVYAKTNDEDETEYLGYCE